MTKKQIQKMTQKRKYKTIKSGIVSTLITTLIFSVFCLVIITRLQAVDYYQVPVVSSVIDSQKKDCESKGGRYSLGYHEAKGYDVSSCWVDGELESYIEFNR